MSILTRLLLKKVITKEQVSKLEDEAKSSAVSIEKLILSNKIIDEDTLFSAKAEELNLPLRQVSVDNVPIKVMELIP